MKLLSIFRKKWFRFLIIIAVIFGGYFYWQNSHKQTDGLKTYVVEAIELKRSVSASGKITAADSASLKFQTGGRLAWVGVKAGDTVKKWQTIASLDQRQLEKDLKKKLLTYSSTRATFEETTDTYEDEEITDSIKRILEKNQNSLDASVVDVEIADLAKQYASIYSPIDGIVVKATEEHAGVNISVATTEYVVVNPDSLRFSAEIEETDIGSINVGQSAIVNLDAFSSRDVASSVGDISFTPTETTSGNTAFIVNFPIPIDARYRLGMNGNVEIVVEQKQNSIAVPIEAVRETETERFVTVLKSDQTQEERNIKTGMETEEYFEVTEGLQVGDVIILP